jgi:3-hydroxyacyl-CoA dehydrogenase
MFVRLVEVDPPAVSAALGRIRKIFDEDVWAGRLDRLAAQQAFNRVSPTIDWTGLELAELVVEAVLEKIDTKRDVFSRLDRIARPTAVLATNTSSLRVADIAQTTLHAERVVGMHFFNPVPKMPLVEIVRGPHSDDASLATVLGVAGRIGKTPVLINDGPGFLVNRILVPYLAEGLIVASQGTPITIIDHALKAWGMPMGPFELLDEIGLDIAAHIFQLMEQGSVLPSTISGLFLQAMENHWLGKKSGRGFYEYSAQSRHSKSPRPNAELVEVLRASSQPDIQKSDASIQERLVLPMVNEAAKLMEEGITDSTDTIDLATVLGIGLAPFRGGIVQYANTVGMEQIVNQMENLAAQHGRQFAPARLLRQAAQEHRPLSSVERVVPSLLYAGERVG